MQCLPSRQNNCRYETLYLPDCLAATLHHQILLCFQRHWQTKIDSYVSAAINRCSQPTNQPASQPASKPSWQLQSSALLLFLLYTVIGSIYPQARLWILICACQYFSLVHFLLGRMSLLLYLSL